MAQKADMTTMLEKADKALEYLESVAEVKAAEESMAKRQREKVKTEEVDKNE